jgi:BirA family biotin operon repressor/biotin-[acetyl-CoA-carboxylase] ligase
MIHFQERCESTQAVLKEMLNSGAPLRHLDAIRAGVQTRGRGRQGREWSSLHGNLFATILISEFSLPRTWIPHWIGMSLLDSLRSLGIDHPELRLKWPNDLVFEGKAKLAGILCETSGDSILAGIGVNVLHHPEIPGREISSLARVFPGKVGEETAASVLEGLIGNLKKEPSIEELRRNYEQASSFRRGDALKWQEPSTGVSGEGSWLRLGEHGELVVQTLESGIPVERSLFSEEIHLKAGY